MAQPSAGQHQPGGPPPDAGGPVDPQQGGVQLREQAREQILTALGGWSGTLVAAIPPVVFVAVNAAAGLRVAIIAAIASAVALSVYRLVRRQPLQQALSGLFTVAVAAAIAARTGEARGYFLLGIVAAIGYAAVFAVSIVVRRPLVGVLWEYLDPSPLPAGRRWHQVPELHRAYFIASWAALAMFASRGVVQLSLFRDNRTGLLAVAKLAMGYPLYIAVVALCFWVVRRARHGLSGSDLQPDVASDELPAEGGEPESAGADGAPDRGLGLWKRDE